MKFAKASQILGGAAAVGSLLMIATVVPRADALDLLGSSPEVTEYRLPTPLAGPCEIEFDDQGRIWIEEVTGNAMTRFDPATKTFKRFPMDQPLSVPGGMEFGPDGGLWFAQVSRNLITRLDPADGSMESVTIPEGLRVTSPLTLGTALPSDATTGKDGAMWFTMSGVAALARVDIQTREVEVVPLPTPLSTTSLLTQIIQPGPGNLLVVSLGAANKIATIDVFTREIKEYAIPTPAALPQGVTTDRNGRIWFTESLGQKFGWLDVATGQIKEYSILALRGLGGLSLTLGNPLPFPGPIREGSDGMIYIAQGGFEGGNRIGRFNPTTGAYKEFVVPTPLAGICDLNNTQDGAIWFGEFTGNSIGKLSIS
jgi:virginiamycin B lyase